MRLPRHFKIAVWATQENATLPNYAQSLVVWEYVGGEYPCVCRAHWNEVDEQGFAHSEYVHFVQEVDVDATGPFDACRKFREWREHGLMREFLTDPR